MLQILSVLRGEVSDIISTNTKGGSGLSGGEASLGDKFEMAVVRRMQQLQQLYIRQGQQLKSKGRSDSTGDGMRQEILHPAQLNAEEALEQLLSSDPSEGTIRLVAGGPAPMQQQLQEALSVLENSDLGDSSSALSPPFATAIIPARSTDDGGDIDGEDEVEAARTMERLLLRLIAANSAVLRRAGAGTSALSPPQQSAATSEQADVSSKMEDANVIKYTAQLNIALYEHMLRVLRAETTAGKGLASLLKGPRLQERHKQRLLEMGGGLSEEALLKLEQGSGTMVELLDVLAAEAGVGEVDLAHDTSAINWEGSTVGGGNRKAKDAVESSDKDSDRGGEKSDKGSAKEESVLERRRAKPGGDTLSDAEVEAAQRSVEGFWDEINTIAGTMRGILRSTENGTVLRNPLPGEQTTSTSTGPAVEEASSDDRSKPRSPFSFRRMIDGAFNRLDEFTEAEDAAEEKDDAPTIDTPATAATATAAATAADKKKEALEKANRPGGSASSSSDSVREGDNTEEEIKEALDKFVQMLQGAMNGGDDNDDDDGDDARGRGSVGVGSDASTSADTLLRDYFDPVSRAQGRVLGREGAGRFQSEVLRDIMSVSRVTLSEEGAVVFSGTPTVSVNDPLRYISQNCSATSRSSSSRNGSGGAVKLSVNELFAAEVAARFECCNFKDEVDYLIIRNEVYPSLENGLQAAALDSLVQSAPAVMVFPRSWNTTAADVVNNPLKTLWRQLISSAAVVSSMAFATGRVDLIDSANPDLINTAVVTSTVFPMAVTAVLIANLASFAEFLVAKSKKVELSQAFIPSFSLFNYGQRSTLLTRPRNRNDLFDIAAAGTGTALVLSLAAVYAGLSLTQGVPKEVISSEFPTVPVSLLQLNTVLAQIFEPLYGSLYGATTIVTTTAADALPVTTAGAAGDVVTAVGNVVSSSVDGGGGGGGLDAAASAAASAAGLSQVVVDTTVHVHWLAVVGAASFISTVFSLLPVDNSAGSKLSYSALGRESWQLVSGLAGLFKLAFFTLMIFNVGGFAASNLLTRPKLMLDYVLFSQLVNSDRESQIATDSLSELDTGRKYLYYGLMSLLALSLFPYADFSAWLTNGVDEVISYTKSLLESSPL